MGQQYRIIVTGICLYFAINYFQRRLVDFLPEYSLRNEEADVTKATNSTAELPSCDPGGIPLQPCKIPIVITMCEKSDSLKSIVPPHLQALKFNFERQVNQTLTLIKSILLSLRHSKVKRLPGNNQIKVNVNIELIIISNNEESVKQISYIITTWDLKYTQNLHVTFGKAMYFEGYKWMQNLYAPCSTLRLLLPELLPAADAVIYVDTDILFLQHPFDLWAELKAFESSTEVAMVRSRRQYNVRPLVRRLGLRQIPAYNSGVMLMNLTRLRINSEWRGWLKNGCQTYEEFLEWADQDIMDVYFHVNPNRRHTLPCQWNFVPPFLVNQSLCDEGNGASILHGISSHFFKNGRIGLIYGTYAETHLTPLFSYKQFLEKLQTRIASTSICTIYDEPIDCNNAYFERTITRKFTSELDTS